MSPTIFRYKGYRFFFFSREEKRIHVHVSCPDGEAKFWLEPVVALAQHSGLSPKQLKKLQKIIEERNNEITKSWKRHFRFRG
ncbi:MAG: DUF4160 domain-containing protein [Nitrospinota bacterium]